MTVFIETVVVLCALAGALTPTSYKWGWFVFGIAGLTWVLWVFFGPALLSAKKAGKDIFWAYFPVITGFCVFVILYVIAWACAEGSNLISPDAEFIYYGVLDLIGKTCLLSYHVFSIAGVDYERFGLFSSKASLFAPENALPGVARPREEDNVAATGAPQTTKEAEQQAAHKEGEAPAVANPAGAAPAEEA